MAKISDHRHQPAHGGSISTKFGLIAAMRWLPASPGGLWNQNQVHPIFDMGPYRRPTVRNVSVGLLWGSTSTSGWSVDGAPYHRLNAAHIITCTCQCLTTVDIWLSVGLILPWSTICRRISRRGRWMSVQRVLYLARDELQNGGQKFGNSFPPTLFLLRPIFF